MALHLGERKARLEAHGDGDRVDRRVGARVEHRRRDAIPVRDWVDDLLRRLISCLVGAPAPSLATAQIDRLYDRRRHIAWRHHQRHPQRELIAGLSHRLLVLDLHHYGLVRPDIGDGVGEDVWPLLFHQARFPACGLGLLVERAGAFAILDVADDNAIADHHLERIDGAGLRQRIDVDRLDPAVRRVMEDLADAGARGRAGDQHVDIGGDERSLDVAVVLALEQQRAGARLGRRHEASAKGSADSLRRAREKCRNCNDIDEEKSEDGERGAQQRRIRTRRGVAQPPRSDDGLTSCTHACRSLRIGACRSASCLRRGTDSERHVRDCSAKRRLTRTATAGLCLAGDGPVRICEGLCGWIPD